MSARLALPRLFGHRGAAALAPENTLAGLRRAHAVGARMVEVDVRLSADGVPLLFHDDGLERTSDGAGPVAAQPWAALAGLDAGAWFAPAFAGERIPTLAQALALALALGLAVNLEIKPDSPRAALTARRVVETAAAAGWPADGPLLLLSSFDPLCLEVGRALAPALPRALLVETVPPDWTARVAALGCAGLHAEAAGLSPPLVAGLRAAGLAVMAYTVDDPDRRYALWSMGVDAVCTDDPSAS
mgnify:CR=1 FL=1